MKTVLYLGCRTGLLEPLGRSQILPYMLNTSKNYNIVIFSSEKKEDIENREYYNQIKNLLNKNKIIWHHTIFKFGKKNIPFSLTRDFFTTIFLCAKFNVDIIHCRCYLPNFVGVIVKIFFRKKLIFDMRGLWPEELALGLKKGRKSFFYKILKFIEFINIFYSDNVISLTNKAKEYLVEIYKLDSKRVFTIPTCVDLKKFQYCLPKDNQSKKFSCVGTIISDWFLVDWLSMFFKCIDEYDDQATFEIISKDDENKIISRLNLNNSIKKKLSIKSATSDQMPSLIKDHCASAFFFKSDISKLGSSPTRCGEILAVGRPIICNSGVGDIEQIITGNNIGVIVNDPDYNSMLGAIKDLYKLINDPLTSNRCRNFAESYYSVIKATNKYKEIYGI